MTPRAPHDGALGHDETGDQIGSAAERAGASGRGRGEGRGYHAAVSARSTPDLGPRERVARTAGLATLAIAIALSIDLLTYKLVGYDLAAYILGARRLLAGEPLYQSGPIVLGPFGQFVYPPPVALLFVPFAPLSFNASRAIMLLGLAAVAAALAWWLTRGLRPGIRYFAAAGVVQFFPLVWEVSLGNLTLLTLALCLVSWRLRGDAMRSGVALAAALGLKLLLIPLVPFLLTAGRYRSLAAAAIAGGAVVLVTLPLLWSEWWRFAELLSRLAAAPPGSGSNIVPVLFSAPALRPLLPALAIAITVGCGAAARRGGVAEEHAFRVALAAVPLFASTLWYPYLIFSLPLLVASAPGPPAPWLRPLFAAVRPLAWVFMQDQALREPGRDFLFPLFGLLLLLAVGLTELRFALGRVRSEKVPSQPLTAAAASA